MMQYFIDSKDGSLQAAQNCGDRRTVFHGYEHGGISRM